MIENTENREVQTTITRKKSVTVVNLRIIAVIASLVLWGLKGLKQLWTVYQYYYLCGVVPSNVERDLKYIFVNCGLFITLGLICLCYIVELIIKRKIKKATIISVLLILIYTVLIIFDFGRIPREKDITEARVEIHVFAPIIYLYPEQTEQISVSLNLEGELTTTYPLYEEENNEGWNVTATPEGVLTDSSGRNYSYLFWEAILDMEPDLGRGFCVAREDTIEFLETSLNEMGLNEEEANGFIMYWLPQLEANEYNFISFQTESYEAAAGLEIEPQPDTVIRVFMMWCGVDHYIEVEPQDLTAMNPSEREGFTVVEWGGTELEDLDLSSIR